MRKVLRASGILARGSAHRPRRIRASQVNFAGRTPEGVGCLSHCVHDGGDEDIPDAPECGAEEVCYRVGSLPDGVGLCEVPDSGG